MNPQDTLPAWQRRIAEIPESQAHLLLDAIAARHGWAYALWTRADAVAALGATPHRPARVLGGREWQRITASSAWTELPRLAYDATDTARLIQAALKEAGLQCSNCDEPLHAAPGMTGRLCGRCRRGPAEPDPDTGGLWYLDGDQLYYAHPDPDDQHPTIADAVPYDPATATVDQRQRADLMRQRLQAFARISFRDIIAALQAHGIPAAIIAVREIDHIGVGQPVEDRSVTAYPVYVGPAAGLDDQIGSYGLVNDLYVSTIEPGDGSNGENDYIAVTGDTADTIATRAAQALAERQPPPSR